ncbi:MAG: PEGA domain-containing protein [Polyangiaceae bacterium]
MRARDACAALLLFARAATAEPTPPDEAKRVALHLSGQRFYEQGDYAHAIEAFEQAYAAAPNPKELLAQAWAHKKIYAQTGDRSHKRQAITLYRAFIATHPEESLRKSASDALDTLAPLDEPDPNEPTNPAPPVVRKTTLAIDSSAEGALVSIDGGAAGPPQFTLDVTPGPHHVRVSAPGYRAREVEVTALPEQITPARVELTEIDGTVILEDGMSFITYVDGRSLGRVTTLTLTPGAHFVSVTATGRVSEGRRVVVGRASETRVAFEPKATSQRWAGIALSSIGGAGILAGLVTLGFAVDRDARASELDAARLAGSIDAAAFDAYPSLHEERDALRSASLATLGVAAGVGILGVTLVFADRPEPISPPAADTKEVPKAPAALEVVAAPLVAPSLVGGAVSGRF